MPRMPNGTRAESWNCLWWEKSVSALASAETRMQHATSTRIARDATMRRMKHLVLVVAVLAGCSKEKEEPKTEPKAVEAPRELPPSTYKEKTKTTAAAFGKKPAATFGKIEKVKLGMSEADAKAALPELFAGNFVDEAHALSFTPIIAWGKLWRIEVKSTSLTNVEPLATEAWGEGTKAKGTIGEVVYWWDPATNTRAMADSSDLDLQYYVPLEQLLGEPGKPDIAALPKPVLGITADELKASYRAQMKADDKLLHIYLPPTE